MTEYYNNVGPGYVPPPLADDDQVKEPVEDKINLDISVDDTEIDNGQSGEAPLGSKTNTAGFMGISTTAWIAIVGIGLYYAYTKGMLKKIIK